MTLHDQRSCKHIPHFAALVVPIESTEFDSDRSPSLPKVGSLFMAGGESAIAGNYTCRAAEQRSLHTLGRVTTDYSAKWCPPPALLLLLSTNIITQHNALQCSVLIITSTPKLNQKECGPKSLQWRVCTALHCANLGHVCRRKFALTTATGQETRILDGLFLWHRYPTFLHLQGFESFPLFVGRHRISLQSFPRSLHKQ